MDPYHNNSDQVQDTYAAGGNIYDTSNQMQNPSQDNSMSQTNPQMGVDMTQPYQPPPQNTSQQVGIGSQDFLTVQKSPSRILLIIIGGIVFLGAIGAVGGMLYFSYGSSQADEPIQQADSPAPQQNNQTGHSQSPAGLTIEDPVGTTPENAEAGDEAPAINEYILEEVEEASGSSAIGAEGVLFLTAIQESTQVGEPYTITLSYSSLRGITAFDILLLFDSEAFDISESDIVPVHTSFDTFAFYKDHEDGYAHLSISGVKAPGKDISGEEKESLLEVTFTPTKIGTYDFVVLDTYGSESTKFVNSEDQTTNLLPPESITVEVEDEE